MSEPITSEIKEPSMNDVKAVLQNAIIAIRILRIIAATVIQRHVRGDTAEPGITMLHDGLELTKAYRNAKVADLLKQ